MFRPHTKKEKSVQDQKLIRLVKLFEFFLLPFLIFSLSLLLLLKLLLVINCNYLIIIIIIKGY